jgi:nucleotide-binding universal stress UspA family protein
MERILVGIDSRESDLAPGIHAVNLAKRIRAKVYVLLVKSPGPGGGDPRERELIDRLEKLIDQARSEGLNLEYFISEGLLESETIRFIQQNAITLLVVGQPQDGSEPAQRQFRKTLENIRLRVDCHIEVVHQRDQSVVTERK